MKHHSCDHIKALFSPFPNKFAWCFVEGEKEKVKKFFKDKVKIFSAIDTSEQSSGG
jgi:hypothetical protein